MSENPFANLDLQEAIDLEWTVKDIEAKRWLLCPVNPAHLEKLKALGLVEMQGDDPNPVLTDAGVEVLL
jgi:hypothetical protein